MSNELKYKALNYIMWYGNPQAFFRLIELKQRKAKTGLAKDRLGAIALVIIAHLHGVTL
jgi:hypothetical protein